MSYRFALIGRSYFPARHAQDIVKQGALMAELDTIPEKTNLTTTKIGATSYFSTTKLILQRKTGNEQYIKKNYQPSPLA